ncbi:fasciclin domain-containing protein [Dyella acidiphila]|uniref:Fasciclin domain-containing protein n=1 Tax=Dyella acidiphila TaxID=2775866 RepID=A0ABR9G6G5_9GAMM|nr:fasciclin domain-containing protein [Dyella acidiphila]MBE1159647.1 fasciclin domain-containing protein [Dyella acidiphila]
MSTHDSNTSQASSTNIVDTAVANGSFQTLGKAIDAADLASILKSSGPFTFFAPTDAAFAKLPQGMLDSWFKPENRAELISVLKYHVLPGRASAVEVEKLTAPTMMQGQKAPITKDDEALSIAGAKITQQDITSSNGVIHAIDTVLVSRKR